MKKLIKSSFIIVALLSSPVCYGYFYTLFAKAKVINKRTNKRQIIIGLADYHLKSHPANKSQRDHVEAQIKRCVDLKGKVIVEDLSSINNDGKMVCCNFGINCAEGVLGQLANKARAFGIAVDNVEYRYCRVAAIGPLLKNIQINPCSFKSCSTITTGSLHKEVVDEIAKIKKYNDGKFLNDQYKRTICRVEAMLSKLRFSKNDVTIADYCKKLEQKKYRQELEKLCIFDSGLLDMNIMHAIAVSPDVTIIFVIAGGSHIEQVSALLKRMGYKSIIKKADLARLKFKKIPHSDAHPEPIDITVLDQFIR